MIVSRRDFAILVGAGFIAGGMNISPAMADGSTTGGPKKKTAAPKSGTPGAAEKITPVVNECASALKTLCPKLKAEMNVVLALWQSMLRDTERALRNAPAGSLAARNLTALHKKLQDTVNKLTELATGKSASFIKEGKKNIGPDFCKRKDEHITAAKASAGKHDKSSLSHERRSAKSDARKNMSAASRIVSRALEGFIDTSRAAQKSLKNAIGKDGSGDVVDARRLTRFDRPTMDLMNRTSDMFAISTKIAERLR